MYSPDNFLMEKFLIGSEGLPLAHCNRRKKKS